MYGFKNILMPEEISQEAVLSYYWFSSKRTGYLVICCSTWHVVRIRCFLLGDKFDSQIIYPIFLWQTPANELHQTGQTEAGNSECQ